MRSQRKAVSLASIVCIFEARPYYIQRDNFIIYLMWTGCVFVCSNVEFYSSRTEHIRDPMCARTLAIQSCVIAVWQHVPLPPPAESSIEFTRCHRCDQTIGSTWNYNCLMGSVTQRREVGRQQPLSPLKLKSFYVLIKFNWVLKLKSSLHAIRN